jgi:type VI secretion system protein ImpC
MATEEKETQQATAQAAELKEEKGLLDQIIEEGRMAREETQKTWARDLIGELVAQIMEGTITVSKDTLAMINARISAIDHLVSKQLNEVLHHPDFKKLEASWRGLHYLVNKSETGERMRLRVLNVSKADLLKDMEKAAEFDQSALFKKVYEEEYGMFGGAPYGALIGDYEFSNHPQDLTLLEKISGVAAAAHAPFIAAASPKLINLDSFTQLGAPRDLAKIFQGVDYAKWKSFRDSEDSRYVALALPHILMRLPYGKDNVPVESFSYEEDVTGADHGKYLWGNAAYALGTKLTDAFARYSWCAAIRGVEGGGLVEGLPVHTFQTDEGDVALKCPAEIAITDRREKELADLGFIPLVHCKGTDYAAFFSTQSSNKPKVYDKDAATANARLSSQIQYILAVSRFAHYLKSMMRDKLGSFMSRSQAEDFLNRWIAQYVLLDDSAGQDAKASHPLREARIEVSEIPGKPGAYRAVAFLKPHFQLDELTVSLRLVADLPPPAKG